MANPQKRYEYLVKEHKRLHDLVEYMKNDSVSSEAIVKAKREKTLLLRNFQNFRTLGVCCRV